MADNSGTSDTVFESERLICRRWTSNDLDAIYDVYSDEEGSRWVDDGTPITREECEQWLVTTIKNYEQRGYGMFALDEKSSGRTIGFCGLVHPNGQILAEVKYAFLRSHWGKGFASEAIPRLLSYGTKYHQLTEIIATVDRENMASQRVLQKSNMKYSHGTKEADGSQIFTYRWRLSL
ncbi:MAG: GNAT family N-acetyltransferase [Pseudomonadota bacterium]